MIPLLTIAAAQPPGDNIPWWAWVLIPPLVILGMVIIAAVGRGRRW